MIFTFGYGNRTSYDVLSLYVQNNNIKYIIDVRRNPRAWNRRWYGKEIAMFCHQQGIKYTNDSSLGNTSGKSNWVSPDPEQAEQSLVKFAKIASSENILLLCAEMDSKRCHRTEVAERLKSIANTSIQHLK